MKRYYGKLTLEDDAKNWVITGLEPHVAIRLKQIFPRVSKSSTDHFCFPNDDQHCADLDWFCSRYPLQMPDGQPQTLQLGRLAFEETQAELGRIMMPTFKPQAYVGLKEGRAIRPYQAQAIEVLRRIYGLLLGDDLGLGKTYAAAGFFLLPESLPAAVVVQTHLQRQWAEKLGEFTTLRTHQIRGTKPYSLPDADVYIFRYSQLLGWVDVFAQGIFTTVAYDEVQELRTGDASLKGQAAKTLSEKATFRLGLSATPIYNFGQEIWNIMQFITPGVLGTYAEFSREWCDHFGKVADPQALGTYLREQHAFIRRTKREVGQQVPPINRIVEIVETDEKALGSINALARKLAMKTLSGSFTERGKAALELDLLVRHATGVGKAASVAAYVRILLEANVPVMLMGWHRDCFARGTRVLMYDGTQKSVEEICVGDQVMGPDSKPRNILSLVSGNGPLFRVKPKKGEPWICSENHILALKGSEKNRARHITVSAREYGLRSDRWQRGFQLYRSDGIIFPSSEPVIEPWLMGYWLGDGAASLRDLRVASADPEVLSECSKVAGRYGLTITVMPQGPRTSCSHILFSSGRTGKNGRNALLNAFRAQGVNDDKHIPSRYKTASVNDRRELLAGLIDSDGHVYGGNGTGSADYTSKIEELAHDVAFVARSLGLAAYISSAVRKTDLNSMPTRYYRVCISGDLTQFPMRVMRKQWRARSGQKNVRHVGFTLEDAGRGDFFGFECDGDHLFLLGDYTVVHNCYDIWNRLLADFKPVMYTGSESPSQKNESLRRFMAQETNLFIMSLRSGAGVDGLQGRCSTVVFGEMDWSPKVHEQVIGRLDREGQTEQVTAIYLNSEDGSDPPMVDLLGIKASQSSGIVDPGRVFEPVTSDTSRIRALALQFLSKQEIKSLDNHQPQAANDFLSNPQNQMLLSMVS